MPHDFSPFPPASVRPVWTDAHGEGRCVFALFRRAFTLSGVTTRARLHLFADTRYRLHVNGQLAAYGPARFLPNAPEFDTVDLLPFLRAGENILTVEINSVGTYNYEAAPSRGGFIAWGEIVGPDGAVDLSTPGAWLARRSTAWDEWAPPYSFAQGPIEILDCARLREELSAPASLSWHAPVSAHDDDAWGPFTPRSIPMLDLRERLPAQLLFSGPLAHDETRLGFRAASDAFGVGHRLVYATHIHSPVEQDVVLGLFWGPHFLNGEPIKPRTNLALGNREDYPVRLRAGWNFLYGEPEALDRCWGVLLGLPVTAGLRISAEPRNDCPDSWLYVAPQPNEVVNGSRIAPPASFENLPAFPRPWQRVARSVRPAMPARELAWDRPAAPLAPVPEALSSTLGCAVTPLGRPEVSDIRLDCAAGRDAAALFDFGGEYLGHVVIEVTAPAGAILDVGYSETLRPHGLLDLFSFHWGVNTADRFVCAGGGRERIEAFHHRGGRYLQISVREAPGPVVLHRVALRQTVQPLDITGDFSSPDPVFNWSWRAGVETMIPTTADAFVDPWRERAVYIGDTLVEFHALRAMTPDLSMTRRCLWLWAMGQRPDGQMLDVIPAWKPRPLHDYTLVWLLLLRDYWAASGDTAFVASMWPHVERIWASPDWEEAPSGLWLVTPRVHIFGDWGIDLDGRRGESCLLNAFRHGALECCAELATLLEKPAEARRFTAEAGRVARAFQTLRDPATGRYAASRLADGLSPARNLHGNILALHFGLVPPGEEPELLAWLAAALGVNHRRGLAQVNESGTIELYFLYFALGVLYDHGLVAEAEAVMRNHYALLMHPPGGAVRHAAHGSYLNTPGWTLWEQFVRGNSHCHGWACCINHYFAERTLGVRSLPGRPDSVSIQPQSALDWAKGVVPHPRGPIHVSWQRRQGRVELRYSVPPGVSVASGDSASPLPAPAATATVSPVVVV